MRLSWFVRMQARMTWNRGRTRRAMPTKRVEWLQCRGSLPPDGSQQMRTSLSFRGQPSSVRGREGSTTSRSGGVSVFSSGNSGHALSDFHARAEVIPRVDGPAANMPR